MNLGDYNSVSNEVTIEEDLPPGMKKSEKLNELYDQAGAFLAKKMLEEGVVE